VTPFPIVLSAPSGAGKTTLARRLGERRGDVAFSVSATTRAPRPGERDGVDYHFVDRDAFRRMVADGELIEWAEVHGALYGTPLRNVRDAAARGAFLVLDIDVQGARQIRRAVPEAVLVFVAPPSGEALMSRLVNRGSEDPGRVRRRLEGALTELEAAPEFDHVVVNDEVDGAVADLEAVLDGRVDALRPHPPLDSWIEALSSEIRRRLPAA
jgi:guanylate kinase